MSVELPGIIKTYIEASNAHDVPSILACFSDDALVHDEEKVHQGKKAIEGWVVKTIAKYQFHFKPVGISGGDSKFVAAVEVSGTFDGSPITLDYHFTHGSGKISSLSIG